MSTPLITNITPAEGEVVLVGSRTRYSVRDLDSEIDRASLQLYLGEGPVYYVGDELPEDIDFPRMYFEALSGHPNNPAAREIDGGYLKISKLDPGANQEAVYRMGGLEASANPDDPFMFEFTLKLDESDIDYDGPFSGIAVHLFTNNSGCQIHFGSPAGIDRYIYIMDATLTANVLDYVLFDWEAGLNPDGSNTYKVLWDPPRDVIKLYVKDPSSSTDRLLYSGTVSQFATLPDQELRANQPWMVFGHGAFPNARSVSRWKGVYFHNIVTQPIRDGIILGEHETSILSNNQVDYDGEGLPKNDIRPWMAFPDSFEPQEGSQRTSDSGVVLTRTDASKGFGFYRVEPKVATGMTTLDFKVKGAVIDQGSVEIVTGMEVYVDDGTKSARVTFLQDSSGTQNVGVLLNPLFPEEAGSYLLQQQAFNTERHYRLQFISGTGIRLFNVYLTEDGLSQEEILSASYADLPDTSVPGPGIGFGHVAATGAVRSEMTIREVKYSVPSFSTEWDDYPSSAPTWLKSGLGEIYPGSKDPVINSGFKATIEESLGVVTVNGLTNMSTSSVGNWLHVLNGDNPGYYKITQYQTSTSVVIDNLSASGLDSGSPNIQWEEIRNPSFAIFEDPTGGGQTVLYRNLPGALQSDSGWSMEFQTRVVSYELTEPNLYSLPAGADLIRTSTGVMFAVHDGTYTAALYFLEVGPPEGKVVALLPGGIDGTELELVAETVQMIRSGDERTLELYAPVDWTEFHHYRLEKTVGGKIRLLIDGVVVLELDAYGHDFPTLGTPSMIAFGSPDSDIRSVSEWKTVMYALSDGFDVSSKKVLSEEELLTRFNYGMNMIAEAEDL